MTNLNTNKRGLFILIEGVDRCGKTTQTKLVEQSLNLSGYETHLERFPKRSSESGKMIDSYLKGLSKVNDKAIHLLFSANRWQESERMIELLESGTNIICDRYCYSGVAFSTAKSIKGIDMNWCKSCDSGLPSPDIVIYLDIKQEDAEKRSGYGSEIYENRLMQMNTRKRFDELRKCDELSGGVGWHTIDANNTIDTIHTNIMNCIYRIRENVDRDILSGKDCIKRMWN